MPNSDKAHVSNKWMIVGEQSSNSLLVRGGLSPQVIKVSTPDSSLLHQLVEDANRGLVARTPQTVQQAHDDSAPIALHDKYNNVMVPHEATAVVGKVVGILTRSAQSAVGIQFQLIDGRYAGRRIWYYYLPVYTVVRSVHQAFGLPTTEEDLEHDKGVGQEYRIAVTVHDKVAIGDPGAEINSVKILAKL